MQRNPPPKESFNLATGLPADQLVRLKGAGQPGKAAEVIASKVSDLQSALRQTLPLLEVFEGVSDMSKSELCLVESALILALRESPKANEFLENHHLSIAYGGAKAELGLESDWPIFGLPSKVLV